MKRPMCANKTTGHYTNFSWNFNMATEQGQEQYVSWN